MSGWDDLAVSLLGSAIKLAPAIGEVIAAGLEAKPEHPLAPKIREMLPERNASREALERMNAAHAVDTIPPIPPTEPGT